MSTRRRLSGTYAALSLADTMLVGLGPRARRLHHVVKPLLMPVLAARLAHESTGGPLVRQVLAAQGLSWGGDVALMGSSERRFLTGVASFLGAHVAYVAAFRTMGSGSPGTTSGGRAVLALSTLLVPANAVLAGRRDARFSVPVGVYGLVLAAMAASAASLPDSRERGRIQAGAALFLLSDNLLGAQLFLRDEPHPALDSAVMATYTSAQWLISDGVRMASS
jgi:uncharacterized membrane protein YhhN